MNRKVTIAGAFIIALSTVSSQAFGGGSFSGAKEWTQISNKLFLGKQLTEQANMYKKQIQEYQTQLGQFDLEKIAGKVFDTSGFDETISKLDAYQGAFDLNVSKANIEEFMKFEELKGAGEIKSADFLQRLGQATDKNLELNEKQSEFTQKKMESIETDRQSILQLQAANKNAEGAMQAAQIGNHINSEIVGQMIKLRQEQAAQAQIQSEKDAIKNETEAAKAAMRLQSLEKNQSVNSARNAANNSRHGDTPSDPFGGN